MFINLAIAVLSIGAINGGDTYPSGNYDNSFNMTVQCQTGSVFLDTTNNITYDVDLRYYFDFVVGFSSTDVFDVYVKDFKVRLDMYSGSSVYYSHTSTFLPQSPTIDFFESYNWIITPSYDGTINFNLSNGTNSYNFDFSDLDVSDYVCSLATAYIPVQNTVFVVQNAIKSLQIGSNDYQSGYNAGYDEGVQYGSEQSYQNGYNDGWDEGFNADSTAFTIFNGILSVAMVPVNFFLAIFNFEILGINLTSMISALLSVAILIIVIRIVTGKSSGD